MAKNEAKIKFTAETGEFNNQIKKANSELGKLRAETKLNETQMKNTGTSIEGLQQKHKLLQGQLTASQSKTEALTQKVNKAVEIFGENSDEVNKLKTQLANAQTEEERLRKSIDTCNQEIADQERASKEAESATSQLTDKIEKQQTELNKLKQEYVEASLKFGDTSDEAKQLEREISELSSELKQSKTQFSQVSGKADELDRSLDKVEESADQTGDGFTVMKGVIADLASSAIQSAIGKISEFVGWLGELPEATRELRQDFATLNTSFDNMGLSSEQAKETWKELYAVFGEDDRAVETANHIAKISDNQKDLNDWVTITTGIWGTYQDSLPVEGLAEASNETIKTGQVTGVLADALNWGAKEGENFGIQMKANTAANEEWNKAVSEAKTAEDFFNLALSECSTEQERQQLITSTLTSIYGDAADKYRETSGAQMEAKEATADNIQAEADLANAVEPVTTAFTELKTSLLNDMAPAIEKVSGGMVKALEWAKEHPVAMKALASVLGVVAAALSALAIVVGVYTVAQWAMNAAVLANPITWIIVGIVAAIAAVVAIIVVVIEYWDKIVEAVKNCVAWICEAWNGFVNWIDTNLIQPIVNFFKGLWDSIVGIFQSIVDWVKNNWKSIVLFFINPFAGVFNYLYENFSGFRNFIDNIVQNIKNFFVDLWSSIKSGVSTAINSVKNVITSVKSTVSSVFNGIKSTATNVWDKIKTAITKPIEEAKDKIKGIIDTIKGFFSNLNLKLPKIKMPHFKITGKLSLSPPSVPKLKIDWYKDGGIMMRPTIFGMNGNRVMAGGEAGPEAILPIDRLEGYIENSIDKSMQVVNLGVLADKIEDLANRPIALNINGRRFAYATASDGDSVNGLRTSLRGRGLVLD